MSAELITRITSIIMSAISMIAGLVGIGTRPSTEVVQGFDERPENTIRIMSFNVRCSNVGLRSWRMRAPDVCTTIRNGMPDSFGVQEATDNWMEYLDKNLTEYGHVGIGRDDGSGEHSAVFYLKDKYDVIDSDTFWLSPTPEVSSKGWDAAFRRVCTYAVLKNKESGLTYVHINSHFDHIGVSARSNSVDLILKKAEEFGDLPVVFTADMNVTQGSEDYVHITSGVLRDAKFDAPDTMDNRTFHDSKSEAAENRIIDYILINSHFNAKVYRVVTEQIDGNPPSDHHPIYADLEIV